MSSIPATTIQYSFSKIGSYENLVKSEVPIGKIRANDVLVKIHAVSLQFRDLAISKGIYRPPNSPPNLVPLSDCAGEVLEVGEDVTKWKKGDRVCANFAPDHIHGRTTPIIQSSSLGGQAHGVLTQYRTFPAHSLVEIPAHLSFEEASTLPCAGLTAYNALHGPTPIKAGDFVLVLGTGGVSIFALQFAAATGATVIATSSSDDKLKIAAKHGAKHLINYNKTPNWDEEVMKITNGEGADHIIEVGGQGTLERSIKSAKTGSGYVQVIGFIASGGEASVVFPLLVNAVTLRGISIGSVEQFNSMNRLILANPDVTRPVIDKVFNFDDAIAAYAYLELQKHVGKVVIKVA